MIDEKKERGDGSGTHGPELEKGGSAFGVTGQFLFFESTEPPWFWWGFLGEDSCFPRDLRETREKIVDRTEEWVGHTARAVKTSSTKWGLNTLS